MRDADGEHLQLSDWSLANEKMKHYFLPPDLIQAYTSNRRASIKANWRSKAQHQWQNFFSCYSICEFDFWICIGPRKFALNSNFLGVGQASDPLIAFFRVRNALKREINPGLNLIWWSRYSVATVGRVYTCIFASLRKIFFWLKKGRFLKTFLAHTPLDQTWLGARWFLLRKNAHAFRGRSKSPPFQCLQPKSPISRALC